MYAENLFASANIRKRHYNAAVKASRTQQRGIQHIRTVRGGNQSYAFVRFKAIHRDQQLVERLCALIVSAAESGSAMAPDCVNFVNKDDAGSILLALLKQVADAACAHADEHLYKVRTGNREERNVGFAGNCPGQQGFACSRMSYQQYALGNASAQLLEFLRFAQELNDLAQLFLRFVHSSHVFERDFLLLHGKQSRAALAETQGLVAATLHLANHDEEKHAY